MNQYPAFNTTSTNVVHLKYPIHVPNNPSMRPSRLPSADGPLPHHETMCDVYEKERYGAVPWPYTCPSY